MVNGGGKHPKKKAAAKRDEKPVKKTAADLSREQLTKNVRKPEKPTS